MEKVERVQLWAEGTPAERGQWKIAAIQRGLKLETLVREAIENFLAEGVSCKQETGAKGNDHKSITAKR